MRQSQDLWTCTWSPEIKRSWRNGWYPETSSTSHVLPCFLATVFEAWLQHVCQCICVICLSISPRLHGEVALPDVHFHRDIQTRCTWRICWRNAGKKSFTQQLAVWSHQRVWLKGKQMETHARLFLRNCRPSPQKAAMYRCCPHDLCWASLFSPSLHLHFSPSLALSLSLSLLLKI